VYDVIVLGGGPAGYAAAIRTAQLGGNVLLAEAGKVGGTCLHRGCIPSKVLYHAASSYSKVIDYLSPDNAVAPRLDRIAQRQRETVEKLYAGLCRVISSYGIITVNGHGEIISPGLVRVGSAEYRAKKIIIATGSREAGFSIPGAKFARSAEESLKPPAKLCRVTVIGGGNTGLELASAYALLGFKVTVIEKERRILPALADEEIRNWLSFSLRKRGLIIDTGVTPVEIRQSGRALTVTSENAAGTLTVDADLVIAALGRRPNLDVLGEGLGELKNATEGYIQVNDSMETLMPDIFAAGDVTGPPMLAHLAYAEGIAAADNAMGIEHKLDRSAVPHFLSAHPGVAWAGMTETQAAGAGLNCRTVKFPFAANAHATILGQSEGMVKIVALEETGTVVGMQILGGRASEMIMEGVLAIQNGLHVDRIAKTIHPHPTFSETIWEAALSFGEGALHGLKQ
jgi:dihydrolipoamide dehydrogenase